MKYVIRYVLPLVAAGLFAVAIYHVSGNTEKETDAPPSRLSAPPESPYQEAVAGAGMIEPESEAIEIGSSAAGLVKTVLVQVGHSVKPEQTLFELDDRELQAQLIVQKAALESAQAELERLKAQPREEEIPVTEAMEAEAKANLEERRRDLVRIGRLFARSGHGGRAR